MLAVVGSSRPRGPRTAQLSLVVSKDNHTSRAHPAGGRRKLPPTPANPRKASVEKARSHGDPRLSPLIPNHQDRPVTPEVAGSSPVAPVKVPANRHLLSPLDRRPFLHPAWIPHAKRPEIPAGSRS